MCIRQFLCQLEAMTDWGALCFPLSVIDIQVLRSAMDEQERTIISLCKKDVEDKKFPAKPGLPESEHLEENAETSQALMTWKSA